MNSAIREARLSAALNLALCWLIKNEPKDSRAVSDEFVAMSAVLHNIDDKKTMKIINAALAKEKELAL